MSQALWSSSMAGAVADVPDKPLVVSGHLPAMRRWLATTSSRRPEESG
jgi:hypothetical protein